MNAFYFEEHFQECVFLKFHLLVNVPWVIRNICKTPVSARRCKLSACEKHSEFSVQLVKAKLCEYFQQCSRGQKDLFLFSFVHVGDYLSKSCSTKSQHETITVVSQIKIQTAQSPSTLRSLKNSAEWQQLTIGWNSVTAPAFRLSPSSRDGWPRATPPLPEEFVARADKHDCLTWITNEEKKTSPRPRPHPSASPAALQKMEISPLILWQRHIYIPRELALYPAPPRGHGRRHLMSL